MNWAQIVQSHALSFFHLSGPDLLLGMDSDPAQRNVMGLIDKYPDVARNGIRLRRFGQKMIEMLGGRSVHPAWTVPGGVRDPLSDENRSEIIAAMVARGARQLPAWRWTCLKDAFDASCVTKTGQAMVTSPVSSWVWSRRRASSSTTTAPAARGRQRRQDSGGQPGARTLSRASWARRWNRGAI